MTSYSDEEVKEAVIYSKNRRYTQVWATKLLGEVFGNAQLDKILWASEKYLKQIKQQGREKDLSDALQSLLDECPKFDYPEHEHESDDYAAAKEKARELLNNK